MSKLLREAAVAALVCGSLAACATPQYPISADDAKPHGPIATPAYPIEDSLNAPQSYRARGESAPPPAPAAAPEAPAPLAAPVGRVESQPLPPPGPSASAGGAKLQYASLSTDSQATGGAQPATMPAAAPVAAPSSAAPQPSQQTQSGDATMTPRQVIHDQPGAAAPPPSSPYVARQSATLPPPAGGSGDLFITGPVVSATGDVYENYEVQPGEHVDQLARNFSTTRDALLDANHIRAPFVIRPGQIIKVPVTKAYVARTGDTLVGVARRFSVSSSELAQLNHVEVRAVLRAGQEIGLPSSMRDRGPQRLMGETEFAEAAPRRSTYSYAPSHGYVTQVPQQPTMVPDSGYHAAPAPPPPEAAPTLTDAQVTAAARGRFAWPLRGNIVKRFGPLGIGQRNDGVDIKAPQGADVKAAAPGEVVYAGNQVPGFGNLVLIKHSDGWVTAYAHLDNVSVQMRQQVSQGQSVGSVGMTGGLTEPELHFEVRYAPTAQDKARPIDPVLVLPAA
jgi:murein DD-endopeptidase MepM/ murein hydrolase activator NlpD